MRTDRHKGTMLIVLAMSLLGCHPHPRPSSHWDLPWRMGKLASIRLGPAFKLRDVTPLSEFTSSPDKWVNRTVRTRGRIVLMALKTRDYLAKSARQHHPRSWRHE